MDIAIPFPAPARPLHAPGRRVARLPLAHPAVLPEPPVWERHACALVDRLSLPPGAAVLEVGCGSGAAALAAARAVGPAGRVIGVDVDEPLLRRARDRAHALGLRHVDFLRADFARLPFPDGAFDAVICLFHFGPGLAKRVRELWRLVAPGGTLAVTSWGPQVFEPLDADERAQMLAVATASGLAQVLHAGGANDVSVEVDGELVIGRARKTR